MNPSASWVAVARTPSTSKLARGALFAGLLAGTGGHLPQEVVLDRFGTGSVLHGSTGRGRSATQHLAIDLRTVRSALRLSVAELARLFNVSRPTIYSWQTGNPSKEKNAALVRQIAAALAPHQELLAAQSGRVAHRAIQGKQNLLGLVGQGEEPSATMDRLVGILQQERAQRDRLARRLAGKTRARGEADNPTLA